MRILERRHQSLVQRANTVYVGGSQRARADPTYVFGVGVNDGVKGLFGVDCVDIIGATRRAWVSSNVGQTQLEHLLGGYRHERVRVGALVGV